jgi:hypothetical protein
MQIVESFHCAGKTEDWSACRSPSRAKRRRRMGHKQRVKITFIPWKHALRMGDKFVMHPLMAAELGIELAKKKAL